MMKLQVRWCRGATGKTLVQEECDMLLKWYLAATQMKKGNSSLVVVDMNVAYAAATAFSTWQWKQLDFTLCN